MRRSGVKSVVGKCRQDTMRLTSRIGSSLKSWMKTKLRRLITAATGKAASSPLVAPVTWTKLSPA